MSSDAFVCGSLVDWFGARHLPHMGAPPALLRVEQLVCTLVATSGLLRLALHRFSHHLGDVRECSFSERRAVSGSFSEPRAKAMAMEPSYTSSRMVVWPQSQQRSSAGSPAPMARMAVCSRFHVRAQTS